MPNTQSHASNPGLPRLFLTLGDVAGIGPEIVCKGWKSGELHKLCRPAVVGDMAHLRRLLGLMKLELDLVPMTSPADWDRGSPHEMLVLQAGRADLQGVRLGELHAAAGRAAHDFLTEAIQRTLRGEADGLVTAPLHKGALRLAGVPHPGHTEILAEQTGTSHFAMMLYGAGLLVAHATLHVALRDLFPLLSVENILAKIRLTHDLHLKLAGQPGRIGVCGLNPHAGDGGLFGDEEARVIAPAVEAAQAEGILASGPWPSDTLFSRARGGAFQGLVAMYHDQGHIPMKLLAGWSAVNISAGLPLVRTSVAHGTAFDIATQFRADPSSLVEAVRVAARLSTAPADR